MYSRQYHTTAGDRAARGQRGRGDAVIALSGTGAPPYLPHPTPLSPVIVNHPVSNLGAALPSGISGSLMDIENEVLESLTVPSFTNDLIDLSPPPNLCRDVRFGLPSRLGDSSASAATQYREPPSTRAPVHAAPLAWSTCNWPTREVAHVTWEPEVLGPSREACPPIHAPAYNEVRHPNFGDTLSKVDRTVITELIKKLRVTTGNDEIQLVNFLKSIKPMFDFAPQGSRETIKLLTTCVAGQLFKLWLEGISCGVDWEELHRAILDKFIPNLRRREIESLEIDRPQRLGESFSEYIEEVVGTAFAIRTRLTEWEIVDIVMNKCRPEVRSHFGFGAPPCNLSEVRILASRITSSLQAEKRYFGEEAAMAVNDVRRSNERQPRRQPVPNERDMRNDRRVTCFRCNQPGHLARDCRQALNWRRNP